jgi:hypothetical protein
VTSAVGGNYLPTGGGTLTGALTGTSATFSNDAIINNITVGQGNNPGQWSYNTAIGKGALASDSGYLNTAIGFEALTRSVNGPFNTAIGGMALTHSTTAAGNTAICSQTMYYTTTGDRNTAVGTSALSNNTSGDRNVAIGDVALVNNTNG